MAISVAKITTTIIVGARNAVKKGASATSKLAKTLGKIAEKAAPVLGALLNLAAGVLKLGAKAVGFLSENLWLLAVMIAFALYDQRRGNKNKKYEERRGVEARIQKDDPNADQRRKGREDHVVH